MTKIGLVIREGSPDAQALGRKLISWGKEKGLQILLEADSAKALKLKEKSFTREELCATADQIVTLGGDGTFLGVARHVTENSPVMIGVNFGQLGFLTEIAPSELFSTLEAVQSGETTLKERAMLYCDLRRQGKSVFSGQALNDAAVQKGAREKLLDLDLIVNGEGVMRIRGDGVLIATPTGSTAYSLAAGGSIVHPSLGVVLLTPICPHSLASRPLILPMDFELEVSLPPYSGRVFLMLDGQVTVQLEGGDLVHVTRSKHRVRFVKSPSRNYFEILRTKLNWGISNKGE